MTRLLARRTLRTVLGLMFLVEAIFLAESFTTIMEETIRNGGTALDLGLLLSFKLPEVVDFALPLALMLGLYFAITGARDDNELMICATAGVPWTRIPAFAAKVGVIGLVVSILFSGILTPLSAFAYRLSLVDLEARLVLRQIREPGGRNLVRTIQGQTVIATPATDPAAERGNLFIYKPEPGGWRINQADDWFVAGPDAGGDYTVRMKTFRETSGQSGTPDDAYPKEPEAPRQVLRGISVSASTVRMSFRSADLIRVADTARRSNEVLLLPLVARVLGSTTAVPETASRRFGELLSRALLCPVAALLAAAAAAWSSTRAGRFAALPFATVLVLGCDIAGRAILGDAAMTGGAQLWVSFGVLALIGMASPLAYILWRGELIVAPGRARA